MTASSQQGKSESCGELNCDGCTRVVIDKNYFMKDGGCPEETEIDIGMYGTVKANIYKGVVSDFSVGFKKLTSLALTLSLFYLHSHPACSKLIKKKYAAPMDDSSETETTSQQTTPTTLAPNNSTDLETDSHLDNNKQESDGDTTLAYVLVAVFCCLLGMALTYAFGYCPFANKNNKKGKEKNKNRDSIAARMKIFFFFSKQIKQMCKEKFAIFSHAELRKKKKFSRMSLSGRLNRIERELNIEQGEGATRKTTFTPGDSGEVEEGEECSGHEVEGGNSEVGGTMAIPESFPGVAIASESVGVLSGSGDVQLAVERVEEEQELEVSGDEKKEDGHEKKEEESLQAYSVPEMVGGGFVNILGDVNLGNDLMMDDIVEDMEMGETLGEKERARVGSEEFAE